MMQVALYAALALASSPPPTHPYWMVQSNEVFSELFNTGYYKPLQAMYNPGALVIPHYPINTFIRGNETVSFLQKARTSYPGTVKFSPLYAVQQGAVWHEIGEIRNVESQHYMGDFYRRWIPKATGGFEIGFHAWSVGIPATRSQGVAERRVKDAPVPQWMVHKEELFQAYFNNKKFNEMQDMFSKTDGLLIPIRANGFISPAGVPDHYRSLDLVDYKTKPVVVYSESDVLVHEIGSCHASGETSPFYTRWERIQQEWKIALRISLVSA